MSKWSEKETVRNIPEETTWSCSSYKLDFPTCLAHPENKDWTCLVVQ